MKHTLIFFHIPKTAGTTLNSIIRNNYSSNVIYELGWQPQISINKLKKLDSDRLTKLKVISGHMTFGIHNYIPHECSYVTILRNPIDRVISFYNYLLRAGLPGLTDRIKDECSDITDFLNSEITRQWTDKEISGSICRGFNRGKRSHIW